MRKDIQIFNINRESDTGLKRYLDLMKPYSWLFRIIEAEFNNFMDANGDRNELSEMYFSEDAIYEKKESIRGAIEMIFEIMDEENLPFIFLNDRRIDLSCAFANN